MKKLLQNERAERWSMIDGDVVEKLHVTLNHATKAHYHMKWYIDFTDVSRGELMKLAAETVTIRARNAFKSAPASSIGDFDDYRISVREYLDNAGTRKLTDEEKLRRLLAKVGTEKAKEILGES